MKQIPYGRQSISNKDLNEVVKSLSNDLITTGPYVKKFENLIKKTVKVKFALTCTSGTAALHLAFMSINLKKEDVIILPIINFIAASNLASILQAKIYYADVCPNTGQMTPETLEACIKKNKLKNIKAIVVMYLGGNPDNIKNFYYLKKKYKFYLLEDACHALGSKYIFNGKIYNVGCCIHSDICIFSLHPLKTITSGEGGIVATNNLDIFNRLIKLKNSGIDKKDYKKKTNFPHWLYDIKYPGLNYRLSDINCSLGYSQLKKINKFISKRKKIAKKYIKFFKKFSNIINFRSFESGEYSSWHLFIILIDFEKINKKKGDLLNYLLKNNIIAQQHYMPIYKYSFYKSLRKKKFEGAEKYYKKAVSLPIYSDLTIKQVDYIKIQLYKFFKRYES
jgi:dTDP-4-amino-4,6-dideoxygalactose transaminase